MPCPYSADRLDFRNFDLWLGFGDVGGFVADVADELAEAGIAEHLADGLCFAEVIPVVVGGAAQARAEALFIRFVGRDALEGVGGQRGAVERFEELIDFSGDGFPRRLHLV